MTHWADQTRHYKPFLHRGAWAKAAQNQPKTTRFQILWMAQLVDTSGTLAKRLVDRTKVGTYGWPNRGAHRSLLQLTVLESDIPRIQANPPL
jgi:hypothetical protein